MKDEMIHKIEKLISEKAKNLQRQQPPENLWEMIETKLKAEKSRLSIYERMILLFRKITFPKWQPMWKYTAIATSTAFLFLFFWLKIVYEPDPIRAVEKAENRYLKAIEKLEQAVEQKETDLDMNLWILYQERLALLDESIEACKRTIEQNAENINARKYLFLAYQEKVETLKKILNQSKG